MSERASDVSANQLDQRDRPVPQRAPGYLQMVLGMQYCVLNYLVVLHTYYVYT